MLLEGKVALITGAASGIGRATAELFAAEGAKVVVADIDEIGGKGTVDHITRGGGDGLFVQADVGKMAEVDAMVKTVLDRYGRIDVVHSNAAAHTMGTATEITEDEWEPQRRRLSEGHLDDRPSRGASDAGVGWGQHRDHGLGPRHPRLRPLLRVPGIQRGAAGPYQIARCGLRSDDTR